MTDIRTLLREAAPQAKSEPEITALVRRASIRRRARRRVTATVLSVTCIAAIAAGVLATGPQSKASQHRVAIQPATGESTTPTAAAPSADVLPFSPQPNFKGTLANGMYPPWPQLHVTLLVQTEAVTAGTTIQGDMLVTNGGNKPIARAPGRSCAASFVVALESPTYKPAIAWAADACELSPGVPVPVWAPGVTSVPFTISTTYTCGGQPSTADPCTDHWPPLLPPGTYHTFVASNGMALPQPRSVNVTVR
jgi:hypothetical protein